MGIIVNNWIISKELGVWAVFFFFPVVKVLDKKQHNFGKRNEAQDRKHRLPEQNDI